MLIPANAHVAIANGEEVPSGLINGKEDNGTEQVPTVFLKTIIPSRKATKQYLGEESDDEA